MRVFFFVQKVREAIAEHSSEPIEIRARFTHGAFDSSIKSQFASCKLFSHLLYVAKDLWRRSGRSSSHLDVWKGRSDPLRLLVTRAKVVPPRANQVRLVKRKRRQAALFLMTYREGGVRNFD